VQDDADVGVADAGSEGGLSRLTSGREMWSLRFMLAKILLGVAGVGKAFGLFMDMDEMLGADIEKGLDRLKAIASQRGVL